MNVHYRLKIDELHEFLKSNIMHESDPRRRIIDDAFGTILNKSNVEQIHRLGWYASMRRSWSYFAAIAIYSDVWGIHMKFRENDYIFVKCLQKYLPDFPRLAYLNVPLGDPKLISFELLIYDLVSVPEYRDFWASFAPVEQKALPALDKEEMRNAINVEVNAWRSSFESHLKDELRECIKQELKQELHEDIRNELKAELKVSIEQELKAEFKGDVEASQDVESGPTVTYEMEQSTSGVFSEKDSNSPSEDSTNVLLMEEPRNESKGVATETVEELPGDLVSVEQPKIKVKITKNEKDELKDEHKDELAVDSTNDQINQAAKQEMCPEIQKELEGELRLSIEEESKAEIREPIETKVDEVKLTVPHEMEQRDVTREEVSNSSNKESANGLSMDDVRNETKRIVTEAIEELKGDLVNVLESKIKAKIAKSVKNELKDELAEEAANDLMDFKRDMRKKQSKMMDTLREQLHEDIKDEIVQMIQQELKKCLQDLRRTKPN